MHGLWNEENEDGKKILNGSFRFAHSLFGFGVFAVAFQRL